MFKIIAVFALITLSSAVASQTMPHEASPASTRIEVDEAEKTISFFVENELKAFLDKEGLTVDGAINAQSFLHDDENIDQESDPEGTE